MNRLTKKKQGLNMYVFNRANEIPSFNDGMTLLQIVGKFEDIFELIEEMYKKPVCWKADNGEEYSDYYTHSTILYNPKTNEIEIYEYEFIASYKVEEYGITWWFKEESE
ncbi:MAG: hypothetical protein IKF82_00935 [Bacilli bacterium]|nr:hypothetical protein [Bacilli bacterium]